MGKEKRREKKIKFEVDEPREERRKEVDQAKKKRNSVIEGEMNGYITQTHRREKNEEQRKLERMSVRESCCDPYLRDLFFEVEDIFIFCSISSRLQCQQVV